MVGESRCSISKPIRVGLIGAGSGRSWASKAHVAALQAVPDLQIVAVATTREQSAKDAAARTGASLYFTDGHELARHPDVDVVSVVVKVPAHFDIVKAALNAGKHVFCEWPLAVDQTQAIELRDLALTKGVVHMVGLQARQSPVLNRARDLLREGVIGRVLSCNLVHTTGLMGSARVSADLAWGLDRRLGRTIMTVPGGHSLDALTYCLQAAFEEVASVVETRNPRATVVETGEVLPVTAPDQVIVSGILDGGITAAVHIQGGPPETQGFRLEVYGDGGTMILSTPVGVQGSDLAMRVVQRGEELDPSVPDSYFATLPDAPANPAGNVARAYAQLAGGVRGGGSVTPDFTVAVGLHRLLEVIQQSSDQRRRLAVV